VLSIEQMIRDISRRNLLKRIFSLFWLVYFYAYLSDKGDSDEGEEEIAEVDEFGGDFCYCCCCWISILRLAS